MITILTTRRLRALEADAEQLGKKADAAIRERDAARLAEGMAADAAIRAETAAEELGKQLQEARQELDIQFSGLHTVLRQVTAERDAARADAEEARREVEEARAQVLLDHEDRVALRTLLRTVRQQAAEARESREVVYLLFEDGAFRSAHPSQDAARAAAEKRGAAGGWTSYPSRDHAPAPADGWRVEQAPVK